MVLGDQDPQNLVFVNSLETVWTVAFKVLVGMHALLVLIKLLYLFLMVLDKYMGGYRGKRNFCPMFLTPAVFDGLYTL